MKDPHLLLIRFSALGSASGSPWVALDDSWGSLGQPWGFLATILGPLGAPQWLPREALGSLWGPSWAPGSLSWKVWTSKTTTNDVTLTDFWIIFRTEIDGGC